MKDLCKEQRDNLIATLANLAPEKINGIAAEAKERAVALTAGERKNTLALLFEAQMETLKKKGCPKSILEMLQSRKSEVISRAAEMNIPQDHIPFLPVIPRSYIGIYGLMSMIHNDAMVYLNPELITDEVETPKGPYFIYDVENGEEMLGKSPEKAERLIREKGRSCLTVHEGIALCVHTDVLSNHYVDCTGSRYGRAGGVPYVYLSVDGPGLFWYFADFSRIRWGSASSRSRV